MNSADRTFMRRLRGAAVMGGLFLSISATVTAGESEPRPAAGDAAAGARWYPLCASCHGEHGEGLESLQAPRLAGLPATYIIRQLEHFRAGRRGGSPADSYGQQMAPMAAFLTNQQAVLDVAAFIQGFPAAKPEISPAAGVPGELKRNAAAYTPCAACHGLAAQGSETTGAPPLAGQSLSYVRRQLANFRSGLRGNEDEFSRQMAALAGGSSVGALEAAAKYAVAPQTQAAPHHD